MEQHSESYDQAEGQLTKEDFEEFYNEAVEQYCSHLEREVDENRKQGGITFVEGSNSHLSFREGRPLEFRHIEDHLKVNDFSALRSIWSTEFVNKLNFITDHWWEFSLTYQDHFK